MAHMCVFGCLAYALVPKEQRSKLDDKAFKCIFVGYSSESKGYRLYHLATKQILVSRDVVFVENSVQPMLSCKNQQNVCSHDIFDTLLPLFNLGQPYVEQMDAQKGAANQPIPAVNPNFQPIDEGIVNDVVDEERTAIMASKSMPKWLVQTLRDSKLATPLSHRTRG
ncbi:hypothetical protein, partial [Escherichia coli]|uniref:hypothetical protein n=1 Tax=Escherichia coli TaxID=562 RepID=UPI002577E04E